MKAEIKGKALIDFEKILKEVEVSCFNEGEKVGRIRNLSYTYMK